MDLDIAIFGAGDDSPNERILVIDERLGRLEEEAPESARIVALKFFGGLTNIEVAESLGVNVRTVERNWAYAKACLFQMIREMGSAEGES